MSALIYKKECYEIVGCLYEVYNTLGNGLLEIVYKDALEYEFREKGLFYEREKEYPITYKGVLLKHKFYADFVIDNKIILEVKAIKRLTDIQMAQCINYLKVSQNKLAVLVNFAEEGLEYKRIVL